MKHRLAILAAVALAMATLAVAASAATIDQRQHRQHLRVRAAVRSGALTRAELARVRAGQVRIQRMEWAARRDGQLTGRERVRLHRALDRESRVIARVAHNHRHRGVWR